MPSAITRAELNPEAPVSVGWAMGGATPADIIWTTSAHPLIVHERVLAILRQSSASGWGTYEVLVTGKAGERYDSYAGLAIHGRAGPMDLSQSIVVLKNTAGWYPHFLGHYFSAETWDGSDLFMATPDEHGARTAHIYATERVVSALKRARVRNIAFERLTEVTVSTSNYEIGKDYLLPSDFRHRVEAAYARAGLPRP